MTDTNFPLSSANEMDDLPRTLRRERDRQKAAASGAPQPSMSAMKGDYAPALADEPVPAVVKRLEVPFWRLMLFFLKAVLAAIPALILLGVMLWFAGHLLQSLYPDLIKMKILITFPNG